MSEPSTLSPAGAAMIKGFESCMDRDGPDKFISYTCPAGILTIGWGHTNASGRQFLKGDVWSGADCATAFTEDMTGAEAVVERLVEVDLTPNQFDALVSFVYNCGAHNLATSTLLKLLNAGDYDGAALEFHKWNRGGGQVLNGLVRRRAAEALMFQGAVPVSGMQTLIASAGASERPVGAYAGAVATA